MQTNSYQLYNQKLNGLTVFRSLLDDALLQRLQALLWACEKDEREGLVSAYGAFVSTLFQRDVDFSHTLLELVLNDENRFLLSAAKGEACPIQIFRAAQKELEFFTNCRNPHPTADHKA